MHTKQNVHLSELNLCVRTFHKSSYQIDGKANKLLEYV